MRLQEELIEVLKNKGIALFGIGDLGGPQLNTDEEKISGSIKSMTIGIAVAVPVRTSTVNDLKESPTIEYLSAYHSMNQMFDESVLTGESFLQKWGYKIPGRRPRSGSAIT